MISHGRRAYWRYLDNLPYFLITFLAALLPCYRTFICTEGGVCRIVPGFSRVCLVWQVYLHMPEGLGGLQHSMPSNYLCLEGGLGALASYWESSQSRPSWVWWRPPRLIFTVDIPILSLLLSISLSLWTAICKCKRRYKQDNFGQVNVSS